MFGKLIMSILTNKWTWIVLIILALGFYAYHVTKENNELQVEVSKRYQNEMALRDSLSKAKDSIQTLAVSVGDLQNESEQWKDKYIATKTKYEIAIDTIKVLKKKAESFVIGDSIGVVRFSGTEGIASYACTTEVNVRSNQSTYSIRLAFSDIEAHSFLFYDETDKLWKIQTVSMSPGVKLRGISTIDDETFESMLGIKPPAPSAKVFGVGGLFTRNQVYTGLVVTPSRWSFGVHYKVYDNHKVSDNKWFDNLMVGIHYYIW